MGKKKKKERERDNVFGQYLKTAAWDASPRYSCRCSCTCSCGFTGKLFIEHSSRERRVLDVNFISKTYKSLLMLFEYLQPDFAFITKQVKPLPRMI